MNGEPGIRVCHIATLHKRNDPRIFLKECRSLRQAGYEVHFIVADGKGYEFKSGIHIHDIGKGSLKVVEKYKDGFRAARKALSLNPALFHFHDPELIPAFLWLSIKGKKIIYDAHEDTPLQRLRSSRLPRYKKILYFVLFKVLEALAAFSFSYIITVVPSIYKRYKKKTKRVAMVRNFPILGELKVTTSWEKRENAVCYIGNITRKRGIFEMLEAVAKSNHCEKFYLAGSMSSSLKKEVKKHPGWKKVEFLGFINQEMMKKVMAKSKIGFVLLHPTPAYLNAYPTKLFEYMRGGLPVISSDFDLYKSFIDPYNCGYTIDPFDTDAIAEKVNYLINNDRVAKELGENGRDTAITKFNWKSEKITLIKVYSELLPPSKS